MSQKKTEFVKKVTFQQGKTFTTPFTDDEKKIYANELLNAAINEGDIVVDAEMPVEVLETEVDWTFGDPDDLLIALPDAVDDRKGIFQDLAKPTIRKVAYQDDFLFEYITDGPGQTLTFLAAWFNPLDAIFDWGDGDVDDINDAQSALLEHTYTDAGTYTVHVYGKLSKWSLRSTKLSRMLELRNSTNMTEIDFRGSYNMTSIDNSWSSITTLVDCQDMFNGCYGLSSIPNGMFDNSPNITTFQGTFHDTGNLFATGIPADLFRYNTLATNFYSVFNNTFSTTIPDDLFRYNVLAENFELAFAGSDIISIPDDFFLYNTAITSVDRCFQYCTSLTTAVTGVGDLIDQVETNNPVVDKTSCFTGSTSISDYASIPIGASDWRTS